MELYKIEQTCYCYCDCNDRDIHGPCDDDSRSITHDKYYKSASQAREAVKEMQLKELFKLKPEYFLKNKKMTLMKQYQGKDIDELLKDNDFYDRYSVDQIEIEQ